MSNVTTYKYRSNTIDTTDSRMFKYIKHSVCDFFFFQAEDGIRDKLVTGVQTCALPILCVNDSNVNYTALELPMGGAKASGLGSRHGADGIRKYTQQQALLISRLHPKRDLHMYPYSARMTGVLGKLVRVLYGRGKRD